MLRLIAIMITIEHSCSDNGFQNNKTVEKSRTQCATIYQHVGGWSVIETLQKAKYHGLVT